MTVLPRRRSLARPLALSTSASRTVLPRRGRGWGGVGRGAAGRGGAHGARARCGLAVRFHARSGRPVRGEGVLHAGQLLPLFMPCGGEQRESLLVRVRVRVRVRARARARGRARGRVRVRAARGAPGEGEGEG